jgi:hypothetical protein
MTDLDYSVLTPKQLVEALAQLPDFLDNKLIILEGTVEPVGERDFRIPFKYVKKAEKP